MNQIIKQNVDAESVLIRPVKKDKYGQVEGLDEDELISPEECERQIVLEEFGPLFALPFSQSTSNIRPVIEDGHVHFDAFSTADFERYAPVFDKARYKAEKLREKLKDVLLLFNLLKEKLPGQAQLEVLRFLKKGILEMGDIADMKMYQLAELFFRARNIQKEIAELQEKSRQRQLKQRQCLLGF